MTATPMIRLCPAMATISPVGGQTPTTTTLTDKQARQQGHWPPVGGRLADCAADGQPIDDRRAQRQDPLSRNPASDQLDQRWRTAATTLAS
jgi:hypothetical protein